MSRPCSFSSPSVSCARSILFLFRFVAYALLSSSRLLLVFCDDHRAFCLSLFILVMHSFFAVRPGFIPVEAFELFYYRVLSPIHPHIVLRLRMHHGQEFQAPLQTPVFSGRTIFVKGLWEESSCTVGSCQALSRKNASSVVRAYSLPFDYLSVSCGSTGCVILEIIMLVPCLLGFSGSSSVAGRVCLVAFSCSSVWLSLRLFHSVCRLRSSFRL